MFSGTYEDIIQILGQWRILDLSTLLKKIGYNYSYQAFAKRVKKLEEFGYLGSVYFQSYRKYLFLTDKGLKEAGLEKAWSVNKEIIHHDIISVNVLQYFLGLPDMRGGNLYLNYAGADIRPDCSFNLFCLNRGLLKVAVEVELTQKSTNRIESKFNGYIKTPSSYDLVLYIFQKATTFSAYKDTIDKVDYYRNPLKVKRCKDNIVLILEPEIKNRVFDLLDSTAYFEGKITTLKNIFTRIKESS